MKLKYIFASIVATLALAVSCEKEADHYLDEIKLSTSYVSLPVAGGSVDITVVANDAITVGETPDWLTVSVATGMGAEGKIRFEAGPGEGRIAEVKLTCGGAVQRVNVIQGIATVSTATCAEVIAGPDAKTYRVTGVCKNIYNTQYGNWHLDDGTGDITIYGTLDAKGNTKNFLSLGIEEGDEVTVEGPKTTYNGTVELVDVTVIKINKSLIKVESIDPEDGIIAKEGGDLVVTLANKGNNLGVEIAEADQAWLGISALDGDVVTLHAAANEGGDREATVVFKTTDGKKNYTANLTFTQKGAIKDITAVEFNALEDGTALYRIRGVITDIVMDKSDPTKYNKYGNFYITDGTAEVYVYGLLPEAGGASGQDVLTKLGAKIGDVITVVGPKASYSGTPQMKNAYAEVLEIVQPVTAAEFNALEDGADLYMISGEVTEIVMDKDDPTKYNKYGNFYVKDDTGTVYVYGLVPSSSEASGQDLLTKLGVKVGDVITLVGPKASFKGSAQMKNAFYVSHQEPDEESSGKYVQVTSAPASWEGTYLIVWGNSAHATVTGSDLAATATVTITEGAINGSETVDAASVIVTATEGGYTVTLPSGKYLTFSENKNKVVESTEAAALTFEYTASGVKVKGQDSANNDRYLMENAGGDTAYYRAYKESSFIEEGALKAGWAYPTLFKYVEAE